MKILTSCNNHVTLITHSNTSMCTSFPPEHSLFRSECKRKETFDVPLIPFLTFNLYISSHIAIVSEEARLLSGAGGDRTASRRGQSPGEFGVRPALIRLESI